MFQSNFNNFKINSKHALKSSSNVILLIGGNRWKKRLVEGKILNDFALILHNFHIWVPHTP